jgi:hypothetical protein
MSVPQVEEQPKMQDVGTGDQSRPKLPILRSGLGLRRHHGGLYAMIGGTARFTY